ncbi:hypothetical protein TrLO_g7269, partial [Triparma laevis f. longispina]
MSSPPSMLIDRLINASDGADARSTIAECCSLLATATTDETFHSFAKSFLDDTSFLVNALSLLTNCKLSSTDTFVSEGSSEICQLFIQLLTSPLTTSHTRSSLAAKVLSFATESGTNQSRGIVASLLDMHEGGLTGGSIVTHDCLVLSTYLARDDGVTLFFQSIPATTTIPDLLEVQKGEAWVYRQVTNGQDDDDAHIASLLGGSDDSTPQPASTKASLKPDEVKIMLRAIEILRAIILDGPSTDKASRQSYLTQNNQLMTKLYALATPAPPTDSPYDSHPPQTVVSAALDLLKVLCDGATEDVKSTVGRCTSDLLKIAIANFPSSPDAVSALRSVLTTEVASTLILHALAPPPPMDDEGFDAPPPPPPIVTEIITNLAKKQNPDFNFVGACGAMTELLGCGGEAAKEMLLRIPVGDGTLVSFLLKEIESGGDAKEAMLTMLIEWCSGCSTAVRSVLSSVESVDTTLKTIKAGGFDGALCCLLVGVWLCDFGEGEGGGWSSNTVMELIKGRVGVGHLTKSLEEYRSKKGDWYDNLLDKIRKKIVSEVTSSNGDAGVGGEDEGVGAIVNTLQQQVEDLTKQLNEEGIKRAGAEEVAKTLKSKLKVVMGDNEGGNDTEIEVKLELARKEEEARLKKVEEDLGLKVKDLEGQLERNESELAGLAQMCASLEEGQNQGVAAAGNANPNTSKEELAKANAKIEDLKKKLRSGDEWMQMAQASLEELGGLNAELEAKLAGSGRSDSEAEKEIDRVKEAAKQEKALLESKLQDSSKKIASLRENAKKTDEWMISAQSALEQAAAEKEQWSTETHNGDNSEELTNLKAQVESLKTNAGAADAWMKSASENMAGLAKEKEELLVRLNEASEVKPAEKGEGEEAETVQKLQSEIDVLRTSAAAADQWMTQATATIASITKEKDEFVDLVAKLEEENCEKLSALEQEKADLEAKLLTAVPPSSPERFDSVDLGTSSPTPNREQDKIYLAKIEKLEDDLKIARDEKTQMEARGEKLKESMIAKDNWMSSAQERMEGLQEEVEGLEGEKRGVEGEVEVLKENAKAADDWMKAATENIAGLAKEKEELLA